MKKSAIAAALLLATGAAQATTFDFVGTFDMYSGPARIGGSVPAGANDVTGSFNFDFGTGTGVGGSMTSATPFFGYTWTAHDFTMTANPSGSVTAQIPFDWGAPSATACGVANCDIPVVVEFMMAPTANPAVFSVSTVDSDANGAPGQPMTGGPFIGFSPAFSGTATVSAVPVPAAVWLFGSGLVGLAGVARRRKAA